MTFGFKIYNSSGALIQSSENLLPGLFVASTDITINNNTQTVNLTNIFSGTVVPIVRSNSSSGFLALSIFSLPRISISVTQNLVAGTAVVSFSGQNGGFNVVFMVT